LIMSEKNYENGEPTPPKPNSVPPRQEFEFINKAHMIILPVLSFMIILPVLSKYIGRILLERKEDNWRKKYVLEKLRETRDLPQSGSDEEFINKLDISACLNIIIQNWDDIFKHKMDLHSRDLAHALIGIRNKEGAHYTTEILSKYNYEDVNYALNTIIHFMRPIDPNVADQISKINLEFENKYGEKKVEISGSKKTRGKSKKGKRDYTKYLLNGNPVCSTGGKGPLVRDVIRLYVKQNPSITFNKLKDIFPDEITQLPWGVIDTYENAVKINASEPTDRYNEDDTIKLNNDKKIAVCNQWKPKNIAIFIKRAKELGFDIVEQI